ncbi:MAG: glycosyltransferase family 2 protein [Methylobacterium mesophilicum]|nr:glycosyltransferase family 2 protein [Methylobacterium mesophilicum]
MAIHGLCMVKDEADIVEQCLRAALAWCDRIYVFDNGSTDGSWEIVKRLAADETAIVPFRQDGATFSDAMRRQIFDAFRHEARPGDWWCRLDADEFYLDDPRIFLAKIPSVYGVVASTSITYYFTDRDAAEYRRDPEAFMARPLERRIRHYLAHWGEPRFFRHQDGMTWEEGDGGFPAAISRMKLYPVRIWLKHYQYRSPEQIENRLRARWPAIRSGAFAHEAVADWSGAVAAIRRTRAGFKENGQQYATSRWQDRVVPAEALDHDDLDNRYVVDEALLPRIDLAGTPLQRLRWALTPRVKSLIGRLSPQSSVLRSRRC